MWCTAGFLHLAGLAATADGSLGPLATTQEKAAYRFVPVQVTCDDQGRTRWHPGRSNPPRFKFEVADPARYTGAMIGVLKDLFRSLGSVSDK